MGRDTNVEIFRDTVDLVKTNPALRAEVAASTKKQEIILETDKVEVPSLSKYTENVRVIVSKKSMRGKNEDLIAFVARLKGRKVLIRGNHDDVSDYRYQQLFAEICDYKEIHDSVGKEKFGLVLSHYPIFSWKNMGRGKILLYGHTHVSAEDQFYQQCLKQMKENDCRHVYDKDLRAFNVGWMLSYMDNTPRTLEEIMTGAEK